MTRRSRQRAGWTPRELEATELPAIADPFVVRFGPWLRNFYLGLPAALAFGMVGWAAQMRGPFAVFWYGIVACLAIFCAVPRETRFYADGSVVVARKVFAFVPIWWRRYARTELECVQTATGSHSMSGDGDHTVMTIWLFMTKGRRVAVQSYSDGGRTPPPDVLRSILREKFGLRVD